MKDKLIEIIADVIKIDIDAVEDRLDDKKIWNSLLRVELLFVIEEELDITFNEEELALLDTPGKLVKAALEKAE